MIAPTILLSLIDDQILDVADDLAVLVVNVDAQQTILCEILRRLLLGEERIVGDGGKRSSRDRDESKCENPGGHVEVLIEVTHGPREAPHAAGTNGIKRIPNLRLPAVSRDYVGSKSHARLTPDDRRLVTH